MPAMAIKFFSDIIINQKPINIFHKEMLHILTSGCYTLTKKVHLIIIIIIMYLKISSVLIYFSNV